MVATRNLLAALLIQLFLLMSAPNSAQDLELIIQWSTAEADENIKLRDGREWLAKDLGIELRTFVSEAALVEFTNGLTGNGSVIRYQRNAVVEQRVEPDDEHFTEQVDNLTRTGFTKAWNLTTGGSTPNGEDIVIAVLDAGFQISHLDLNPNLWRNPNEIPNDWVDNDDNGYVDDVHGWNMVDDSYRIATNAHGTQVAGTLGAVGDNGRGISGTNWDTKLMLFNINTVAEIIKAYEYIRQQRMRWNESGGREGALVVATNASFGVEGGTCDQYPIWGSMYDELGKLGILTAAATANRSWDVDFHGDMPTDCQTDYLLGVANVDANDRLYRSSAYGRMNVDLAAPGEGSYSTLPGGQYGPFGSTSAAAPYVTGAIALLYATPCESFQMMVKNDPGNAALLIRDVLLSGVRGVPSVEFRTSSGGILNVAESQSLLLRMCDGGSDEVLEATEVSPNPAISTTTITLNTLVVSDDVLVTIFDAAGREVSRQRPGRQRGSPVKLHVNVAGLPGGYYQLRITERDRSAMAKLIVQ